MISGLFFCQTIAAFGVSCPTGTTALTATDSSTFVSTDSTGRCPSGYEIYDSPSYLTAYFTGALLSEAPELCGPGEYRSNGVCTSYSAGRCDSGYITATTDSGTVGAIDNVGHCAPGYLATDFSGAYIVSTGALLSNTVTLCGSGQYMNNGVCTPYENKRCPSGWIDYASGTPDTFVPTSAGACDTDYTAVTADPDCADYGNNDFCMSACASGEALTPTGQCLQLCTAGITELHVGNYMFNIYATKQTSPALHVKYNDTICYVSLATGTGTNAMHVKVPDGNIYHTTN